MPDRIMLARSDYASYYAYRKAIRKYRNAYYYICRVKGGVVCLRTLADLEAYLYRK